MRIDRGSQPHILRPFVGAIPLRISHKEPLLRSQAVDWLQMLVFRSILPRHPSQNLPTQVGDILAQSELAVDVNVLDRYIAGILVIYTLRSRVEFLAIFLRPPISQV